MGPQDKVLIFVMNMKTFEDFHDEAFSILKNMNYRIINYNTEEKVKEEALNDLRTGTLQILFAIGVNEREIDTEGITYVLLEFLFYIKKLDKYRRIEDIMCIYFSHFFCFNINFLNKGKMKISIKTEIKINKSLNIDLIYQASLNLILLYNSYLI